MSYRQFAETCAAMGQFHRLRMDSFRRKLAFYGGLALATGGWFFLVRWPSAKQFWWSFAGFVILAFAWDRALAALCARVDDFVALARDGIGLWSRGVGAVIRWQDVAEFCCYRRDRSYSPGWYELEFHFVTEAPDRLVAAFNPVKKRYLRASGEDLDKLIPQLTPFCRQKERPDGRGL